MSEKGGGEKEKEGKDDFRGGDAVGHDDDDDSYDDAGLESLVNSSQVSQSID